MGIMAYWYARLFRMGKWTSWKEGAWLGHPQNNNRNKIMYV
jgi:hypothetical protein